MRELNIFFIGLLIGEFIMSFILFNGINNAHEKIEFYEDYLNTNSVIITNNYLINCNYADKDVVFEFYRDLSFLEYKRWQKELDEECKISLVNMDAKSGDGEK